jgi:hypothetical protein
MTGSLFSLVWNCYPWGKTELSVTNVETNNFSNTLVIGSNHVDVSAVSKLMTTI